MSGSKRSRLFRVLVGFLLLYASSGLLLLVLPLELSSWQAKVAIMVAGCLPLLATAIFWAFAHNWRRHEEASTSKLRKVLETEQLQSEAVLDSLDEGVLIMSRDGIVKHVNARMLDMMASTEAYLLGKHFSKLVSEQVSIVSSSAKTPRLSQNVIKVFETGQAIQIEHERLLYHKTNTYLDVAISLLPLRNDQGEVSALMIMGRDISSLIKVQEQKDAFLVKAGEYLAGTLQPVLARAAALRQGQPSDEVNANLAALEDELTRLQHLTEDIHTYTELSLDQHRPELRLVEVAAVFDRASERAVGLHPNKQIKVNKETAVNSLIVDEKLLQTVLDQLVDNAYKFSPEHETVLLRAVSDGATTAVIEVADNGVSITDEQRETIFEPFAKPFDVLRQDSTNLGMSICKKIVDEWGGELKISTQETGGTVISFTIPGALEPQEDDTYATTTTLSTPTASA